MDHKEFEQLYIRSLDETLTTTESQELNYALREDSDCTQIARAHDSVREKMRRKQQATFGSEFASNVMKALQQGISSFDHEMASIFKKIHLLAAGVIIGLLVINIVYADELSVQSVLAFDYFNSPATASEGEDIVLDLSEFINNSK
jgi:hypothetical protein